MSLEPFYVTSPLLGLGYQEGNASGWYAPFIHDVNEDKTLYLSVVVGRGTISAEFDNGIIMMYSDITGTGIIDGDWIENLVVDGEIEASGLLTADFVARLGARNWVAWSKIGELVFDIDRTNDSGRRPMPWKGAVYQVRQMDKNVVVYGEGGVAALIPSMGSAQHNIPTTFGMKSISKFGLKGKYTVTGDDTKHWFIDVIGRLWEVSSEGLKPLGFEEFLNPLGSGTVMSYDSLLQRVYICDGTTGYTLSVTGLGGGPSNLTSLDREGTTLRSMFSAVAGHNVITQSDLAITTTVIDCGFPEVKFLQSVWVDCTNNPTDLECRVAYDLGQGSGWQYTSWKALDSKGYCWVNCSGQIFQVSLRKATAAVGAVPVTQIFDIQLHADVTDLMVNREQAK